MFKKQYTRYNYLGNITNQQSNFCLGIQQSSCAGSQPFSYTQLPISHPHRQSSLTHIYLLVLVICQSPSAQFFDTSLFDGNGHFPISKWPVEGRYKNCTKATDTCKDFNYRDILLIKKEFFYNYFFSMDPVFYSIL